MQPLSALLDPTEHLALHDEGRGLHGQHADACDPPPQQTKRAGRHDFFRLRYSNKESIALLSAMYPTSDVPKLERKWRIWDDYRRNNIALT